MALNKSILFLPGCHTVSHMTTATLSAEIKGRVPAKMHEEFSEMAAARFMRVSDLLREAVREKLAVKPKRKRSVR